MINYRTSALRFQDVQYEPAIRRPVSRHIHLYPPDKTEILAYQYLMAHGDRIDGTIALYNIVARTLQWYARAVDPAAAIFEHMTPDPA